MFRFHFLFIQFIPAMSRECHGRIKNTLSQIRGSISRLTFPSVFLPWLFAGPWIPISYMRWVAYMYFTKFVFGNLEYFSFQFILKIHSVLFASMPNFHYQCRFAHIISSCPWFAEMSSLVMSLLFYGDLIRILLLILFLLFYNSLVFLFYLCHSRCITILPK